MEQGLPGQMSMFEMLGETGTPVIPAEEQKAGRKGWIIEISGIWLKENGFREDAIAVCTRPIIFEEDTRTDELGLVRQHAKTTYGPASGWIGGEEKVYASRPTWAECVQYARERRNYPEQVVYYERNGSFENPVYEYEKGWDKK